MDKIRFKYVGLDLLSTPREERPYYCHFAVYAKDKGLIVDFYTNKDFEGRFIRCLDCTYRQISGTCQFSISRNPSTARRQLKKMAFDALMYVEE